MTRPKRVFAEMLAKAQGGDNIDVDDICDRLTLADIMYELKKIEKEEAEVVEKETPASPPETTEEPPTPTFQDFWSRLSSD